MPITKKITNLFKKGEKHAPEPTESNMEPIATQTSATKSTEFDPEKVTVIYVLGGPGAGKGTESALLVKDYDFVHLSAGDLLRDEQKREGSEYGAMIEEHIREGNIVPMEVTVKLLENAIRTALQERATSTHPGWTDGKGRFLIDGFPRKMDQAIKFDDEVCPASFVLFFTCPEEVLLERLMERGKTSGRADDNEESIKKRFRTFEETSMPVIDYYRERNKVVEIDGSPPSPEVHKTTKAAIDVALTTAETKTQ